MPSVPDGRRSPVVTLILSLYVCLDHLSLRSLSLSLYLSPDEWAVASFRTSYIVPRKALIVEYDDTLAGTASNIDTSAGLMAA